MVKPRKMIGKNNKISWKKVLLIVLGIVFIFLIIFNPFTFWIVHKAETGIIGCDGVEKYYTGNGFEQDYQKLSEDYDKYGVSENGTIFRSGIHLYPRKVTNLGDGKHFDCNDFSLAVECLAKQYSLDCRPVFQLSFPNTGWKIYGTHFVTECENGEVYG